MLTWKIQPRGPEVHVAMAGRITEETSLTPLATAINAPRVVLDLADVHRINSSGCKEWLVMIQALQRRGVEIVLERCSVAMTQQLMMVLGFDGNGTVRSVFAPYRCARCNGETLKLISFESNLGAAVDGSENCPSCGGAMELDDLPENYELLATRFAQRAGQGVGA